MKSLLVALALTVSMSSFAAPKSPENCLLKVKGQILFSGSFEMAASGKGIYSFASQDSARENKCVYAKISQVPGSGRIYFDGRLQGPKGLTNSQADAVKREVRAKYGVSCVEYSCVPY